MIYYLQTLCAVVDFGSFTAAAHRLALTQPAVSQHVKAVERALGGQLLDRSTAPTTLTPLGVRVLPHIRSCLAAFQQAQQCNLARSGQERNHLRLAAGFSVGEYLIPELLFAFRRREPQVRVTLNVQKCAEVIRNLLSHSCEVAIIMYPSYGPGEDQLVTRRFLDEEFVLALPRPHPWAGEESIPAIWLRDEPLILREPGSASRRLVEQSLQGMDWWKETQIVMEMATNEATKKAIQAGLGVGFVPALSIVEDLRCGRLATVRVRGLRITRSLRLAYAKTAKLTPVARDFLQFARAMAGKLCQE